MTSATILHALPGRVRLRVPEWRNGGPPPEWEADLRERLPGLRAARLNAAAGSLVLEYAVEEAAPERFRRHLERRFTLREPPPPAPPSLEGALLQLRRRWREWDARLAERSGGAVSLHAALVWLLWLLALGAVLRRGFQPLPWYAAAQFALLLTSRLPERRSGGEPPSWLRS